MKRKISCNVKKKEFMIKAELYDGNSFNTVEQDSVKKCWNCQCKVVTDCSFICPICGQQVNIRTNNNDLIPLGRQLLKQPFFDVIYEFQTSNTKPQINLVLYDLRRDRIQVARMSIQIVFCFVDSECIHFLAKTKSQNYEIVSLVLEQNAEIDVKPFVFDEFQDTDALFQTFEVLKVKMGEQVCTTKDQEPQSMELFLGYQQVIQKLSTKFYYVATIFHESAFPFPRLQYSANFQFNFVVEQEVDMQPNMIRVCEETNGTINKQFKYKSTIFNVNFQEIDCKKNVQYRIFQNQKLINKIQNLDESVELLILIQLQDYDFQNLPQLLQIQFSGSFDDFLFNRVINFYFPDEITNGLFKLYRHLFDEPHHVQPLK